MRHVLKWTVVVLCCTAVAAAAQQPTDARLVEAQAAFDEATTLYKTGRYAEAVVQGERALSLRETVLGGTHLDVAISLNLLGILFWNQGLYDRAESLYQRALAIREAALGKHHPVVANSVNNLALLYVDQGLYDQAEPLYHRALAIWEEAFGKDHAVVGSGLNNLAILYLSRGLYGQAEPHFQRALAIREAALGKNHPDVATSLNNLANVYMRQGLYDRADPLYQRALAIREAALGKNHPDVATTLHNLALVYDEQGLYGRAEPLYLRALAIEEAALDKNHPTIATSLNNLAIVYKAQGLYDRAEPLYRRALAIREVALGGNHPDIAQSLENLGNIYAEQGRYGRAEPLYQRALAIWEAALGKNPPQVASLLNSIALIRLAQRRPGAAVPLFTRAFAVSELRLRHEALDFSESRLASFLQHLRVDAQVLNALVRAHPEDARVRSLALSAVLLMKGRSVEETANISRTLYRSLGAEDRRTFERLRGLRTQLANLSLEGPGSRSPADYQQRLNTLAVQGDSLEAELAKRSAPLRALTALPRPAEIVGRVAAFLPKDGALVEFVAYEDRPLVPRPGTPRTGPPAQLRYLALVLFPDASTRALDLGPAAPIELAATRLRDGLAIRDAQFQASAQALYRLAFQPLLPILGETRRLFLSPDGQLSLVPFAALHDGRRFLLDSFDFTYLTSGKDLLPRPQDIPPSSSVFVLADPDFHASPRTEPPGQTRRSASLDRFFSTLRADLVTSTWVPLPGTRQEAQGIQRLLPQAQLFLGPEATKERLLKLPTPGILHIATHGFFLEDAPAPSGSRAIGHFGALGDDPVAPRDPLLRSGLALVGARAPEPDASSPRSDAALVTALELAGLDLWGTQLVVLSACDTGRGDVKLGQGVSGLRRAMVVAGAETLVMSLWKVDDGFTHLLMEAYYANLLAGQGRASALREAMRSLRASRPHPHYWAPFISLGSDAPLRAISPLPH
ncbi:CHAT domain-containing tetratricopeptide repeat protein [Pyxidicoccus caerfyrddinensis]|uniref:CHAT domain-containing tetratricopeptide repeat protein n=1 Tax=Pyxidicoccus caerfyrddinensis TaxID=2709663 RepID=UPI001F0836A3|nr:tetratricopeptide repeat protein [Pyxidicoccus caerfyrddinensis]